MRWPRGSIRCSAIERKRTPCAPRRGADRPPAAAPADAMPRRPWLTALSMAGLVAGALAAGRAAPQPPLPASGSFPVSIRVDAGSVSGPLKPIWRFFGADEPNYAYMKHGAKLIRDEGSLARGRVFFRAHNLLTSGDGTPALKWGSTNAYTEDASGRPIYDWTILDRIFDTY